MSQSHAIFFAILAAFLIFVTARGDLPAWMKVLL